MKNLLYLSSALLLSAALIIGCQKGINQRPLELEASHTTIKYQQLDTLVLLGAENDSVKWSVSPSGLLFHEANKATVLFYSAGTYTVSATAPGRGTLTKTITVLNQNYLPPVNNDPPPPPPHDTTTNVPITGDVIVTPVYFKLPNSDSTGFVLKTQVTQNSVCSNSGLYLGQTQVNNNFVVNLDHIVEPDAAGCALASSKTYTAQFLFYPQTQYPITLGNSYPLSINVSGKTYAGSIVFSKTYMDITWNYTSGVIMSSKHITL